MNKQHKFSTRWVAAAGLLAWAAITAGASSSSPPWNAMGPGTEPVRRAIVNGQHIQPRGDDFAQPGHADIKPDDARILDELYKKQMQPGRFMPAD